MDISDFWLRVDKRAPDECWPWTGGVGGNGYGQIWIDKKQWRASRLMYTLVNGPIPDGMFICHKCDNPICVNPAHLFLGTPKDNAQDMMKKGRNYVKYKLTDDQVYEIRKRRFYDGETITDIAKDFQDVSRATVFVTAEATAYPDVHPFCGAPSVHVLVGKNKNAIYCCAEHLDALMPYGVYMLSAGKEPPYTCRFINGK